MRNLTLTIILSVLLSPLSPPVWAAPAITGTIGTMSNGQSVTISGTDFGAHADYGGSHTYLNRYFDDFETGTINYSAGNWDYGSADGASIDTSQRRTGSSYSIKQGNNAGGIGHHADTQQDVLYMYCWRWYDREACPADARTNWKIYRIWAPGEVEDFVLTLKDGDSPTYDCDYEYDQGTLFYGVEVAQQCYDYGNLLVSPSARDFRQSWHCYEFVLDKPNNKILMWQDGIQVLNKDCTYWTGLSFDSIVFDSFHSEHAGVESTRLYGDDYYIDHTQARVMLGNANTFAASTQREIQIPTAWSTTSITINARQGAFANGATAYLYVVKSDGTVNSSGYQITINGEEEADTDPVTRKIGGSPPR